MICQGGKRIFTVGSETLMSQRGAAGEADRRLPGLMRESAWQGTVWNTNQARAKTEEGVVVATGRLKLKQMQAGRGVSSRQLT